MVFGYPGLREKSSICGEHIIRLSTRGTQLMKVHYLANSWGEGSSWEEWSDDLRLPKNFGMKEKLSGWRISQEFLFCSLWFVWLWSHVLIIKQVFSVILVVTIPSSDVFEVWVVWPWPWLNYIKLFCRESSRKKHLCSEKMGSTQARNNMNFMVLLSGNMFLLSEIHLCLAILLCRLPLSGWLSAYRFIWVLKISEQPNDSDPCKSFFCILALGLFSYFAWVETNHQVFCCIYTKGPFGWQSVCNS